MNNYQKSAYIAFIIAIACSITWVFLPKNVVEKQTYIEKDTVDICEKSEVVSKVCRYKIQGYQVLEINLDDPYYAIIRFR